MPKLARILVAAAWLGLMTCGPYPEAGVEVLGGPDSPHLREAVAELTAGLAPGPVYLHLVSDRDASEDIRRRLRTRRPPLLIVLGTAPLTLIAPVEKKVPIVFALVGNPYFTGVAAEPRQPHLHQENVTGIFSPPPVAQALEQGAKLLGPRPWGLIYDPLEGASLEIKEKFATLAPAFGITPLTAAASDVAGDKAALQKLLSRGAQVMYLPPTKSAGRYGSKLLELGRCRRIMVVSSHPDLRGKGAILQVTLDYRRLGEEVAVLARRLLSGEAPAGIPLMEKVPLRITADESLLAYWSGYPPAGRRW